MNWRKPWVEASNSWTSQQSVGYIMLVRRKLIISVPILLGIVAASYLVLTLSGEYIPCTWGTNGIKEWLWAPHGFAYMDGRFPTPLARAFVPFWYLDIHYWHNDWTGQRGPRRTVAIKNVPL